ncbi:cyclic nucleotide-binding domain-containing protein 2-like isoform X2 [Anneissia japonica]|uniref:cyclic nucleotide-binding domain-containing protein 2-like isoform X2 n=1 Tax=Anneissia japonica TaxID=1529436 RepID=UPI0014259450|nr:cyclic nucleotide-binding domain-containing protein 2-like isoform X2 [Anneissia japonica]
MSSDENDIKVGAVVSTYSKKRKNSNTFANLKTSYMSAFHQRSSTAFAGSVNGSKATHERRRYSVDLGLTLNSFRKARRSRPRRKSIPQPYAKFKRVSKTVRVIASICLALKSYVKVGETKLWSLVEMQLNLRADMENCVAFDRSMFANLRVDRGSEKLKSILTVAPNMRNKEDIDIVLALLRGNTTFGNYAKETQISLAKVMYFVTYEPRRIIIKEGHQASAFYVILSGTCLVNQRETDRTGNTFVRTVAEICTGDSFGDEELLNDTNRGASYVCKDSVELLLVDKEDFQKIIREPLEKDREELIDFCKSQEVFLGFPVEKLRSNHGGLTCKYYKPETVVIHNVSEAGHIAIIRSGKCRVIAELVESTKRPYSGRPSRRKRNELEEDWKATAALRRSMSLLEETKKGKLNRSSLFEKLERHDIPKIFIHSPQKAECDQDKSKPNCDGIQRTWKRAGLTTSSLAAREMQPNALHYNTEKRGRQKKDCISTFARIAELDAGSVFGLETVFKKTKNNLSLVSEGADCILVSKKFFKNENNIKMLQNTSTLAINFPPSNETLAKIHDARAWVSFKDALVKEISERKNKKEMGLMEK